MRHTAHLLSHRRRLGTFLRQAPWYEMSNSTNRTEPVVIVDLESLDHVRTNGALTTVLRATGEQISFTRVNGRPDREVVALALEDALVTTRLWRDGCWCRIGFYNPATARISVGPAVDGVVLWAGEPIALDVAGTVGRFVVGRHPRLTISGVIASNYDPSLDSVSADARSLSELRTG